MAYTNFKPTIWSKHFEQEIGKICCLQEDCNTKFQGDVGPGRTVKIIGASRPTVSTYVPGTDIEAAETPSDTAQTLAVDQYRYTHFIVDDVDKAQSVEGLMQALMQGSAAELSETRDAYIASLASGATNTSASLAISTAANAKAAVDAAFGTLWDKGVRISSDVTLTLSPWFYMLLRDSLAELATDNMELIRKGVVGMYNGALVKISNNLYNDETDDYMLLRTKDAMAFAGGIYKVEAYRPDLQFADAIKVLDTFGAKIVRQDELYVIKAHKATA